MVSSSRRTTGLSEGGREEGRKGGRGKKEEREEREGVWEGGREGRTHLRPS